MRIEGALLGAIACGALSFLMACNRDYTPKRAAGVPESAVWAGGADGGAWIECQVTPNGKSNPCKIWNDQTGALEAMGDFHMEKALRAATEEELRYQGFDGTRIHLSGDKSMVPLPGTDPLIKPK